MRASSGDISSRKLSSPSNFFSSSTVILHQSAGLVDYDFSISLMDSWVKSGIKIPRGDNKLHGDVFQERLWLLEYPALITYGRMARGFDLLDSSRFAIHKASRGGQYTYHGPGQRVVYIVLDLSQRCCDVRGFVSQIEDWIISTLSHFGLAAHSLSGHRGVFVRGIDGSESKIAAVGLHLSRWISSYGVSINICPDLSHYSAIVPCGLKDKSVVSLKSLGFDVSFSDFDYHLISEFERCFGKTMLKDINYV